jgi:hypothetical protein
MNFVSAKASLDAESFTKFLPGVKIDTGIIDQLFPKSDGNISFEELKCIGLDPNHPDTLVGVIQVKKSSGYSGGPCTHGSPEYVTFWGDFDGNGSFETCLGTAQVTVYDLPNIPDQGLFYAVRLPVDLSKYRQPCKKGPKVVRIRAILSWNVAVPCSNPDQVPVWGNREETLINISPSVQTPSGTILNLGGISVAYIDNVTGMTTSTAKFVINNYPPDSLGRACPFGGRVTVQGYPVPGYSYIVEVSQDNAIWTPVLTDLWVEDQFANLNLYKANPVTNRFDYLPFTQNAMLLLAQWDTSGNEKWYVRLSVFDGGGFLEGTDTHVIQIDNTWPEVSVNITTGTGNCGKFKIGTLLEGKYVARDVLAFGDQIGQYYVYIQPGVNPPGVGVPTPDGGLVSTLTAPGEDWKLDTTAMTPCGYTINVQAVDRTIINSQWVGHWNSASAGFCLEQPKEIAKK